MQYLMRLGACALTLIMIAAAPVATAQERQTNPEAGSKMERTADKPAPAPAPAPAPSSGQVDTDSVVVQALALALEKYLSQESKHPVEVTFGKVTRSKAGLEVAGFQVLHKTEEPRLIKAERLLIYKLEPGGQDKSVIKASLLWEKISGEMPGSAEPGKKKMAAASLDIKELDLNATTGTVRMAEGLLKGLWVGDEDGVLRVKSLAVKGLVKEKEDLVSLDWGRVHRLKFEEKRSVQSAAPVRGTSFDLGGMEVKKLLVREKSMQASVGFAALDMLRISDGRDRYRLGEIRLDDFGFGPPKGLFIKSLEIRDIGALMASEDGLQGADLAMVGLADLTMSNPDDPATLKLRSMHLDQLTAYYEGKEVAMLDGFQFGYQENGPWLEGGLDLRNLMILGASAPKELKEYLVMVGEDDLVFNFAIKARSNYAQQLLEVQQISLEGRGLGKFEMGMKAKHVKLDPAKPEEFEKTLNETATLDSFTVSYKDEAFTSSIFTNMAKQQKSTVEKLQAESIAQIKANMAQAKSPLYKKFLQAAIGFLERPGEMKLVAKPPKPVLIKSLQQIVDPDQGFEAMGLQTTFKPGAKPLVKPAPPKAPPAPKPSGQPEGAGKPTEVPGQGR